VVDAKATDKEITTEERKLSSSPVSDSNMVAQFLNPKYEGTNAGNLQSEAMDKSTI
jgi:hypothetical protein